MQCLSMLKYVANYINSLHNCDGVYKNRSYLHIQLCTFNKPLTQSHKFGYAVKTCFPKGSNTISNLVDGSPDFKSQNYYNYIIVDLHYSNIFINTN